MDAQVLFRDGVQALKDRQDTATARKLLTQSVKLDPNNDLAWLWLARTLTDKQKQLECVNRALNANPFNERAQALRDKLTQQINGSGTQPTPPPKRPVIHDIAEEVVAPFYASEAPDVEEDAPAVDDRPKTMATPLSTAEEKRIEALLKEGEEKVKAGDGEGAVEAFVRVLEIRVDHELAIANAVRQLAKLGYNDDVSELLNRAIEAGTQSTSIHLTAVDLMRRQGRHGEAEALMENAISLPKADDTLALKVIDHFLKDGQPLRAIELLEKALIKFPDSQKLLVRMGEVQEEYLERKDVARRYFEQAARAKSGTKEAKLADKALENYVPILTDRERGSIGLALREAVGFGVVYLLMAWQDAGLNLLALGPVRLLGIILSIVGGYLVITATSSPQQKPIAAWLGGKVPPPKQPAKTEELRLMGGAVQDDTMLPIIPMYLRWFLAGVGAFLLIGAFLMVFSAAVGLLRNPVMPYIPSVEELMQGALF
jgi:tetratricopeptide (TPR) repeat protein